MKKTRDSRFELLRIFAMLMIVMHHYVCHGNFEVGSNLSLNKIIIECSYFGGKIGINLFVLITGYFMIKSKWRFRKVLELWGEIFFYSVIITTVFGCLGYVDISIGNVIKAIFPILFCRHNYTTTYILLYILIPFINILVKNINKRQLDTLIIGLFIILSVIPTIMKIYPGWTNNAYSYLLWMMFVYIVGARIRLYDTKRNAKKLLGTSILLIGLIWMLTIICGQLEFIDTYYFVNEAYSLPILVASVVLFKLFESIAIKYSKVINTIASSTLAVYLIHDDVYFRNVVWSDVFKGNTISNSGLFSCNIFLTTIIVFSICILFDKIRLLTIHKLYMLGLDKFNSNVNIKKAYKYIMHRRTR